MYITNVLLVSKLWAQKIICQVKVHTKRHSTFVPLMWCTGVSQGLLPAVYETIGPAESVSGLGPSYVRLLSPNINPYQKEKKIIVSLIPGTFSGLIKSSVYKWCDIYRYSYVVRV